MLPHTNTQGPSTAVLFEKVMEESRRMYRSTKRFTWNSWLALRSIDLMLNAWMMDVSVDLVMFILSTEGGREIERSMKGKVSSHVHGGGRGSR